MAEEKILTENELDGVSGGSRIAASDKAKVDADKLRKLAKDEGPETCVCKTKAALTDSDLNCVTGGSDVTEIQIQAKGTAAKATPVVNGTVEETYYKKALADSELNNITGGSSIAAVGGIPRAKMDIKYKEEPADSTSYTGNTINTNYTK